MNQLILLASLASLILSIVLSRLLTLWIIRRLNARAKQGRHYFASPMGSALLFATVLMWCVVSLVAALPWLLYELR